MPSLDGETALATHLVENQPPDRGDLDLFSGDRVLCDHLGDLAPDHAETLARYGRALGRAETRQSARDANRYLPELHQFDRAGRRLDEVRFHPAYHLFMATSAEAGYSSVAWTTDRQGHMAHAAMVYLASQVEPGHCCPLTMTYASVPLLAASVHPVAAAWRAKALAGRYDPRILPAEEKSGVTLGMALTEKQGGSDVRANTTRAEQDGNDWRLTGHKWFCSAPMSDGFLTLAQTPRGLSCFLVPRWLEDKRNGIRLMRLKDKLGNKSNASAEIEYDHALAFLVGEEGDGVRTIIDMIHHTRLDTAMAPAGLMRAALAEAFHWVTHRSAFQRRLIDQPLMRAVLADLALDAEGALALGLHVARAFDGREAEDRAFARIGVALAKYLSNKLCPVVVCEAMEIMGGVGYVEEAPLALLYREAPLNGIWEGSGNVICLDALRSLAREPLAKEVLQAELDAARGADRHYDAALGVHREAWPDSPKESDARLWVERTATLLTASVLLRFAPSQVANVYAATRLGADRGRLAGAVRDGGDAFVLSRLAG